MKKILNRIIIPLCIIGTFVGQLINWLLNNELDLLINNDSIILNKNQYTVK
mgnify:CR=1 FL=1